MKKTWLLVLAVAVLVCLPLTAQAKTEFELGGYIRLDAIWNSTNTQGHGLSNYVTRNNVLNAYHGRFQMNANATRFNFTIKGPQLWGGKVTGFIEVDFDGTMAAGQDYFNQARLRLRHAMFKIAWPDREILFGQFWSVNSELIPDTADSGAYCLYGSTQLRLPQVRYTHKFTDEFNASLAIAAGQNGRWGLNTDPNNPFEGELSETPMVEAKLRYEADLWGKAAWYGKPRGFYVGVGGGYFRSRSNAVNFTAANWRTWGQDNPQQTGAFLNANESDYQNHWLALIENFTPIIPTTTKSLAGTLGLAHQWWIGQGVSAWRLDHAANDRYYTFKNFDGANFNYNLRFIKRYGGYAQLQYYWTEEIYTNLNFGFEKAWGITQQRDAFLAGNMAGNPAGYVYANPTGFDPVKSSWRAGVTQWYRPIPAVKFALQYQYMRTDYFQNTTVGSSKTNFGENHSLLANAWYMF
ncbi:MAG: hypothetical protein ACUVRZ_01560 [Desulfobacca sp.]|uniref:hypothetical protein n=1 Tax=Desulfobacca sp. TaxID=2067990 RepID=UPI004049387F